MNIFKLIKRQLPRQTIQLILGLLIITSCIGRKGVYYNEMSKIPEIITYDNGFEILTGNSIQNSALLIYKIRSQVDYAQKKIGLLDYQAANKKYRDRFKCKIKNISKKELDNYDFYWINPNQKQIRLTIKK
jgi:hypothetical protein